MEVSWASIRGRQSRSWVTAKVRAFKLDSEPHGSGGQRTSQEWRTASLMHGGMSHASSLLCWWGLGSFALELLMARILLVFL
ncbi:hypothetical protein PHYSODRAFT_329740 [Phytophthora sojae]|uniref:Uncharacterized protein n=1 Tax=Phytophthora sojae (strain P6497) TaxID=1094619 RepID=G4Z7U2_PHYSP|nr:hypothetical protein PHYSODRAFT_329740 [Phytophthora sojae]EGZ21845.1 hypothetical protein PHYSODRAFT_329740 [Phytophthora sojae]|eukprot:XP_009524562.1 hypothetical protein PHYSODRAFT_329740 [Phytophthora sojae]